MKKLFTVMLGHLNKIRIEPGIENVRHLWATMDILIKLIKEQDDAAKEGKKNDDQD